jgi:hypothetical protein
MNANCPGGGGVPQQKTSLPSNEDQNDTNHHHSRPGQIPLRHAVQGQRLRPLFSVTPTTAAADSRSSTTAPACASCTPGAKTCNPRIPTTSPQSSSRISPTTNSPNSRRPSRSTSSWLGLWSSLPRAASPLAAPPSSPTPAASSSAAPWSLPNPPLHFRCSPSRSHL